MAKPPHHLNSSPAQAGEGSYQALPERTFIELATGAIAPGLRRLLADVRDGRMDVVVCEAMDRIVREA